MPTTFTDDRIKTLTSELDRLRNSTCQADNQLHDLLVRMTEVQLNLANQDKLLMKLNEAINGNGKPGMVLRVDRVERLAGNLVKAVWLLTGTIVTALLRVLFDRIR